MSRSQTTTYARYHLVIASVNHTIPTQVVETHSVVYGMPVNTSMIRIPSVDDPIPRQDVRRLQDGIGMAQDQSSHKDEAVCHVRPLGCQNVPRRQPGAHAVLLVRLRKGEPSVRLKAHLAIPDCCSPQPLICRFRVVHGVTDALLHRNVDSRQ